MYLTPKQYKHLIDSLKARNFTDHGWANNPFFTKPEGDFTTFYDGTGNNLSVDYYLEIYYQTDSSD